MSSLEYAVKDNDDGYFDYQEKKFIQQQWWDDLIAEKDFFHHIPLSYFSSWTKEQYLANIQKLPFKQQWSNIDLYGSMKDTSFLEALSGLLQQWWWKEYLDSELYILCILSSFIILETEKTSISMADYNKISRIIETTLGQDTTIDQEIIKTITDTQEYLVLLQNELGSSATHIHSDPDAMHQMILNTLSPIGESIDDDIARLDYIASLDDYDYDNDETTEQLLLQIYVLYNWQEIAQKRILDRSKTKDRYEKAIENYIETNKSLQNQNESLLAATSIEEIVIWIMNKKHSKNIVTQVLQQCLDTNRWKELLEYIIQNKEKIYWAPNYDAQFNYNNIRQLCTVFFDYEYIKNWKKQSFVDLFSNDKILSSLRQQINISPITTEEMTTIVKKNRPDLTAKQIEDKLFSAYYGHMSLSEIYDDPYRYKDYYEKNPTETLMNHILTYIPNRYRNSIYYDILYKQAKDIHIKNNKAEISTIQFSLWTKVYTLDLTKKTLLHNNTEIIIDSEWKRLRRVFDSIEDKELANLCIYEYNDVLFKHIVLYDSRIIDTLLVKKYFGDKYVGYIDQALVWTKVIHDCRTILQHRNYSEQDDQYITKNNRFDVFNTKESIFDLTTISTADILDRYYDTGKKQFNSNTLSLHDAITIPVELEKYFTRSKVRHDTKNVLRNFSYTLESNWTYNPYAYIEQNPAYFLWILTLVAEWKVSEQLVCRSPINPTEEIVIDSIEAKALLNLIRQSKIKDGEKKAHNEAILYKDRKNTDAWYIEKTLAEKQKEYGYGDTDPFDRDEIIVWAATEPQDDASFHDEDNSIVENLERYYKLITPKFIANPPLDKAMLCRSHVFDKLEKQWWKIKRSRKNRVPLEIENKKDTDDAHTISCEKTSPNITLPVPAGYGIYNLILRDTAWKEIDKSLIHTSYDADVWSYFITRDHTTLPYASLQYTIMPDKTKITITNWIETTQEKVLWVTAQQEYKKMMLNNENYPWIQFSLRNEEWNSISWSTEQLSRSHFVERAKYLQSISWLKNLSVIVTLQGKEQTIGLFNKTNPDSILQHYILPENIHNPKKIQQFISQLSKHIHDHFTYKHSSEADRFYKRAENYFDGMYEYSKKKSWVKSPVDCDVISALVVAMCREYWLSARIVTGTWSKELLSRGAHGRVEYFDPSEKKRVEINPVERLDE